MDILKNMGYNIINQTDYEKLIDDKSEELTEYFRKERSQDKFNFEENLDYDIFNIKDIIKDDDDKIIDINYEKTGHDLSFMEWFEKRDYIAGMNWYIKRFPHIPYIENLSYFFVKQDLTGKSKLEKYEKNIVKHHLKKEKIYSSQYEKLRTKFIKKIIKDKKNPNQLEYIKKDITVIF